MKDLGLRSAKVPKEEVDKIHTRLNKLANERAECHQHGN